MNAVFPNLLTLHMVTLITSFCLSLVMFIVSQISKKSKPPSNPTFPNFSLQYRTNVHVNHHLAPFTQASAIPVNGATGGSILGSGLAQGWVRVSLCFSDICRKSAGTWDSWISFQSLDKCLCRGTDSSAHF